MRQKIEVAVLFEDFTWEVKTVEIEVDDMGLDSLDDSVSEWFSSEGLHIDKAVTACLYNESPDGEEES